MERTPTSFAPLSGATIYSLLCLLVGGVVAAFLVNLYNARKFFQRLQAQGLPMPPHHPLFGHILLSARILGRLPKDAHGYYLADQINREYPDLGPAFYLDTWPFCPPILVVISPDMIAQYSQERYLRKHAGMRKFLEPLTGEYDLVSMEGQMWKKWRRIFNPGFSATHIGTLTESIVEEVKTFRSIMTQHARKGDLFRLEEHALNLAIDVIGRASMDVHFNSQTSYCEMTAALRQQIPWCSFGIELNVLNLLNPIAPLVRRWNKHRMNRWILPRLEARYASNRGANGGKTVIDLALRQYHEEEATEVNESPMQKGENKTPSRNPTKMDSTFRDFAISQLKLFVFAGHDTTASTICYLFHNLWKSPEALACIREEHDKVFGKDWKSDCEGTIINNTHILNNLPFTTAVIKETLRLFPVVTTTRQGDPGFNLTAANGKEFPTENCLVWGNHHGLHRNPSYWPRPDEFLPERWLVPEGHPLHPVKNAWRPFEFGPRTCIGQELAMTEMKILLVFTIREFRVEGAFAEWDSLHPKKGVKEVRGERAYQMLLGSAHPADGYPCRVSFASDTTSA